MKDRPLTSEPERSRVLDEQCPEGRIAVGVALALIALVIFWSLRAVEMTGGDSDQWCREIETGYWFRKRQMLSFALMQLTYKITNGLFAWDGRWAVNATSCVVGAFFVYFAWRLLGWGRARWLALGLLFSAGFMQLFFGHLETYALPMTVLLCLLLTIRRYFAGRARAIHVGALFSLGVASHLVFWFLVPVFGTVLRHSHRKAKDLLEIVVGVTPALLLTYALWGPYRIGRGEMIGDRLMPLLHVDPGLAKRFAYLSWEHLHEWLWFAWNASHVALPIVIVLFLLRRLPRGPWDEVLRTTIVCFLVFTFVWHPDAGRLDWDLYSFTGLPIALLAGQAVRGWRFRWSIPIVSAMIAVSTVLLMVKVVDAARLGARGEGTVIISFDPSNRAEITTIVLDGRSKKREIPHVLEGTHTVMVFQTEDHRIYKYSESFQIAPDQVYSIVVPATPVLQASTFEPLVGMQKANGVRIEK